MPTGPPSGLPHAQVPVQLRQHPSRLRHLVGCVLGEVLHPHHLARTVGPGEVDAVSLVPIFRLPHVAGVRVRARRRGSDLGLAIAALLAERAQVHRGPVVLGWSPEDVEGLVEKRQVLLPVYQQRAKGVAEVPFAPHAHGVQDIDDVQHAPGVHVQP